ncbi:MAG: aspartate aminotransferase family protein [Acidimicrobiales bacterium]|nr:aspartate aminotransferase family protein [Acidimicrobiales bacterium]
MHRYTDETERLARAIVDYALERLRLDPPDLDHPRTEQELTAAVGSTITPAGIGGLEALRLFAEVLASANISVDHPRFLAFVPAAPTKVAALFDMVIGASGLYGGSWLEASGAVYAENQALAWIAELAGLPATAGGTFVSGGSAANLSALVAARHTAAATRADRPARWRVAASGDVHSSIDAAARVMDVEVLRVPVDDRGRLTGPNLRTALGRADSAGASDGLFAVVATAGTTNLGTVDDLAGVADVCAERGLWLHVDGAYGGAALAAPSVRHLFDGIERADSFVVDPHKWLFSTFDCAALLYREPELARVAHTQSAVYLDAVTARHEWNPSDYAFHLSRRARGLPFWFSLATHGTDAFRVAVETTLDTARDAARQVRAHPSTELLLEPELSVVLFRRVGWTPPDYHTWSQRVLAEGLALVTPSAWQGETVLRFCVVNPGTTPDDIALILGSLDHP